MDKEGRLVVLVKHMLRKSEKRMGISEIMNNNEVRASGAGANAQSCNIQ